MEFETEMKRLTTELMGAFENRMTAVRDAQTNTINQIRTNQSARGAMAAEQQQHLHQQMDALRTQVTEHRNTAQQRMRDTYAAHCDMGRDQRNMLGDFMNHLRTTNATFVVETNMARKQASDDKQHELDGFMAALQSDITQMNANTAAFMQSVGAMRAEMSAAQQEQLDTAKAQLTADITVMRNGMQAAQAALRADHDAAHAEWLRFRGAKFGQQIADVQPAPVAETAQPVIIETPIPESLTSEVDDEKKKMI